MSNCLNFLIQKPKLSVSDRSNINEYNIFGFFLRIIDCHKSVFN